MRQVLLCRLSKFNFIFGLFLSLFFIGFYNFHFFNKFFPLTEGWFSAYAHLINSGLIPYKDFYLYLPPIYPLIIAKFQLLFGETFIALRLLGLVVILLITFSLYLLLARRFNPFISSFCTIVSVVYYQSGVAHIQYDFIQFVTLFTLIGINFLDLSCDENLLDKSRINTFLFFAGLFFAMTFLVKQSNGAFVLLSSAFAVLFSSLNENLATILKKIFFYSLGVFFPILLIFIWLLSKGAWGYFLGQVYFGAIESKGSLHVIFTSWLAVFNGIYFKKFLYTLIFISPLLLLSFIAKSSEDLENRYRLHNYLRIIPLVLLPFTIFISWHSNLTNAYELSNLIREKVNYEIVVISTSLILLQLLYIFSWPQDKIFKFKSLVILTIVEIGMTFGNGTSAGLSEVSAFLGLAYFLGYMLSLPNVKVLSSLALYLAGLILVVVLTTIKFNQPYAWWYVSAGRVQSNTFSSDTPILDGIFLDSNTVENLDKIVSLMRTNAAPDDDVYVFPNISGLYVLSNRWPKSKAIVSWFDFLPDQPAKEEAERLSAAPPQLIVDLDMPEQVWTTHERLFRNGKTIGQRAIKDAIRKLTADTTQYDLIYMKKLPDGCSLSIWRNIKKGSQ